MLRSAWLEGLDGVTLVLTRVLYELIENREEEGRKEKVRDEEQ